jgi:Golgi nucleoside diphosphatase
MHGKAAALSSLSMSMSFSFLFILIIFLSIGFSQVIDDYAIVIDAGSTGSRCFVFHVTIDEHSHRNVSSHPCGKVVPGLSSFASHPVDSSDYIAPLLSIAASRIPAAFHSRTTVHIKATAGMRVLSELRQSIIWNSLVEGLNRRPDIPFKVSMENVGTIDGHAEAFFAVLASNYIAGSIDGNLQ